LVSQYIRLLFILCYSSIYFYAIFLSFNSLFFNNTTTTEIYTLSLHDALPIYENAHNDKSVHGVLNPTYQAGLRRDAVTQLGKLEDRKSGSAGMPRPISYAVFCLKKKKKKTKE